MKAACLMALAAAGVCLFCGCLGGGQPAEEEIDNGGLRIEGVRSVEVNGEPHTTISLGRKSCREFAKMVNGFSLETRENAKKDRYQTAWFFDVEDQQGKWTCLRFFDRILSVDDKVSYRISEEDYGRLKAYCRENDVKQAPKPILACKAYLESIDYGEPIDYSMFSIRKIDMEEYRYLGMGQTQKSAKKVNEDNIGQYRLVSVGDVIDKSHMESGFLRLLVNQDTGEVVWCQ